jgi:hypothetical protein
MQLAGGMRNLVPIVAATTLALVACSADPEPDPSPVAETRAALSSPFDRPLPPPGSEACDAIGATSLVPIVELLQAARFQAIQIAGADATSIVDTIDQVIAESQVTAAWLSDNGLDATNPSAAASLQWVLHDRNDLLLAAGRTAVQIARATGNAHARQAFTWLGQATLSTGLLSIQSGRCFLDKYAFPLDSWWDWRLGKQPETEAMAAPPVPGACAELDDRALWPFSDWLNATIIYEEAAIDTFAGEPQTIYASDDISDAIAALDRVDAVREEMGGWSAQDDAIALLVQSALGEVASTVGAGGMRAVLIGTDLPGPSRYAFETDSVAEQYALGLAAAAGLCAIDEAP